MSRVVAPGATQREIVDALNSLAAKFSHGDVVLAAGTTTTVIEPRIGPQSAVILTPRSSGADASTVRPVPGIGQAVFEHLEAQAGQEFRYVVLNP